MTDERYVYNTDIRERKSAANGARAKKCGSRSKRCHLPSDNMTVAQKRQLNGPTVAVNLNRPMTYEQLQELTPTLQFLYLDHLVSKRHARAVDLQQMLGISPATFYRLAKRLPGQLPLTGKRGAKSSEWVAFMDEFDQTPQEAAQALEESDPPFIPAEPAEAPAANVAPHTAVLAGSIKVRCTADAILGALLRILDEPDQEYTFTVSFEK